MSYLSVFTMKYCGVVLNLCELHHLEAGELSKLVLMACFQYFPSSFHHPKHVAPHNWVDSIFNPCNYIYDIHLQWSDLVSQTWKISWTAQVYSMISKVGWLVHAKTHAVDCTLIPKYWWVSGWWLGWKMLPKYPLTSVFLVFSMQYRIVNVDKYKCISAC